MKSRPLSRTNNEKVVHASGSPELSADRDLAARLLDGEAEMLDIWLDRHLAVVYRYVMHRLGPEQESLAVDITRKTFIEARKQLKRYAAPGRQVPLRLLLLRIAGRKLARTRVKPAGEIRHTMSPELARLRTSLRAMPAGGVEVLTLVLAEELPPEEIAATLGIGVQRAMKRVRAALRAVPPLKIAEEED